MNAWEMGKFEMLVEDMVRTCAQYLFTSRGGHPGASGEDLPQPGDPGGALLSRLMYHGQGEGHDLPAGGPLPQDMPACIVSPNLEAP